jgi:hypothetical protein
VNYPRKRSTDQCNLLVRNTSDQGILAGLLLTAQDFDHQLRRFSGTVNHLWKAASPLTQQIQITLLRPAGNFPTPQAQTPQPRHGSFQLHRITVQLLQRLPQLTLTGA